VSSYCPRSSLPADVLAWLVARLAYLLPPRPLGRGGTPPLALEVRLDAVAAVVLDGLSYRRAGRMDLLLGPLASLGFCQPDGTFVTTLADVQERLAEIAHAGEAVCVDGLATRVQRPRGWANQKGHCCIERSPRPAAPTRRSNTAYCGHNRVFQGVLGALAIGESLHSAGLRRRLPAQCNSAYSSTLVNRDRPVQTADTGGPDTGTADTACEHRQSATARRCGHPPLGQGPADTAAAAPLDSRQRNRPPPHAYPAGTAAALDLHSARERWRSGEGAPERRLAPVRLA